LEQKAFRGSLRGLCWVFYKFYYCFITLEQTRNVCA
jgi:hypothetical protein